MRGLRQRIAAVERALARRPRRPPSSGPAPETAEDWLAFFEALGRAGTFDGEPDFAEALAYYRDAVQNPDSPAYCRYARRRLPLPESCRGQACVRVDGGGNVVPEGADVGRGVCRRVVRAADEGWEWLAGMALRVLGGVPATTEAEFQSLADWLDDVLRRLDAPTFWSGEVEVRTACGAGYRTTPCDLWMSMWDGGARGLDAGEQAEAARRLKGRYDGGGARKAGGPPDGGPDGATGEGPNG